MTWSRKESDIIVKEPKKTVLPSDNFRFLVLNDTKDLLENIEFLNKNYKPHPNAFGLHFKQEHFDWYLKDSEFDFLSLYYNKTLIGCVLGKVTTVVCDGVEEKVFEISCLCIEFEWRKGKKMRAIDLLIAEVSQLAVKRGIYKSIYISNNKHPKPVCKVNYYTYYANPSKLVEYNVLKIPTGIRNKQKYLDVKTVTVPEKKYSILKNKELYQGVLDRLNEKYSQLKLHKHFTKEFFETPIIQHFQLYNCANHQPIGFVSYFVHDLVTKRQNPDKTSTTFTLKHCYLMYYWNCNSIPIEDLFTHTFHRMNMDMIVTGDTLEMSDQQLRMNVKINNGGNAHIHYYTYNMDDFQFEPKDIGLFLM